MRRSWSVRVPSREAKLPHLFRVCKSPRRDMLLLIKSGTRRARTPPKAWHSHNGHLDQRNLIHEGIAESVREGL